MDVIMRVTVTSDDPAPDAEQVRLWLAEQVRSYTGLTVSGFEDSDEPRTDFEVSAISFDSD